jgi:hypothetical protein
MPKQNLFSDALEAKKKKYLAKFIAEFLKSTSLTSKTGEYFQCLVYFIILLVGKMGKSELKKCFIGNWEFSLTLESAYSNLRNSSVFVTEN